MKRRTGANGTEVPRGLSDVWLRRNVSRSSLTRANSSPYDRTPRENAPVQRPRFGSVKQVSSHAAFVSSTETVPSATVASTDYHSILALPNLRHFLLSSTSVLLPAPADATLTVYSSISLRNRQFVSMDLSAAGSLPRPLPRGGRLDQRDGASAGRGSSHHCAPLRSVLGG